MVFNSYEFIFVFLPAVVAVFFALGKASRTWALRWVIAASLIFYALWRPLNVLIIAPSVLINFVLARVLQRLHKQGSRSAALAVLLAGIAFNVAFLGYFKYSNFLVGQFNDAFGTADGSGAGHLAAWNFVHYVSEDRLLNRRSRRSC